MSRGNEHASNKIETGYQTAYAFGHCEAWLEAYARSCGLAADELIHGVGHLLSSPPLRESLGASHRVPALRRTAPGNGQAVATVALVDHARADMPQQERKRLNAAGSANGLSWKQRYGQPHWTQMPKNRARVL